MLMHGCKEGQCAACKSFVLEGEDIELRLVLHVRAPRLRAGGGVRPSCAGHTSYEDLVIELLQYDEEIIRSGLPHPEGVWPRSSRTSRSRTTCATSSSSWSNPTEIKFFPGQYLDISVPGTEESRSFSMANTAGPSESGQLRVRHQGLPRRPVLPPVPRRTKAGRSVTGSTWRGPFGTFTLRDEPGHRPARFRRWRGRSGPGTVVCCAIDGGARQSSRQVRSSTTEPEPAAGPVFREGTSGASSETTSPTSDTSRRSPSRPRTSDEWNGEVGLITDVDQAV